MNAKEFYDQVVAMRTAQKRYFETRSHEWLSKSKQLEKEIDNEIERVSNIRTQLRLPIDN